MGRLGITGANLGIILGGGVLLLAWGVWNTTKAKVVQEKSCTSDAHRCILSPLEALKITLKCNNLIQQNSHNFQLLETRLVQLD